MPADLILITHAHSDHNQIDLIEQRNEDCRIITQNEALVNGVHQKFELGYVTVEAVEAGNNPTHDINECVGYVLTLSDGVSIYVSGDTSTTEQMAELAEKEIDYAFFCCDGHFNMDTEEASRCADLVKAKYSIPYHTKTSPLDSNFDIEKAEMFEAENRLIIDMGEEILLQPNESTLQTQETTSNTESQLTKETFSAEDGTTLPYWLYTPQNAAPGMPMIVYLHGGSVKGNNLDMLMENDGLPKYLKEGKLSNISAYIVMPQTTASRWSDIKDIMYNFVSTMAKTYEIDTSRISLTGHSMGGNGTWDLAAAFPDVFSRIAPLSGAVIASQDIIEALSDVSVWTFVGSEDTIVEAEYTEQFMEQLSTVNESAKLTVLEGIDHFGVPSVAYLDESYSLIDWLIQ